SGGADGGTPTDPNVETFCRSVRSLAVERFVRCGSLVTEMAEKIIPTDFCTTWGPAVAKGRMMFDNSQAMACLSALQALSCESRTMPPTCARALSGSQKEGDACGQATERTSFSECETGTLCVLAPGSCQGKCVKGALLTQPCSATQPCARGETCNLGTRRCDVTGSSGSACGINSVLVCDEGLYCSDLFGG